MRIVAIIVACLVGMAAAHPHVFADASIAVLFDQGGFIGVRNHWVFDEVYSAAILASVDQNADGKILDNEAVKVKETVLDPLAASNYYNYVVAETDFLSIRGLKNFKATMNNGKLAIDFIVVFSVPVKSDYTMITIAVSDPTNYIQITADMENADAEAPDEIEVEFFADNLKGLTLFRAFRSDVLGLYLRFKALRAQQ